MHENIKYLIDNGFYEKSYIINSYKITLRTITGNIENNIFYKYKTNHHLIIHILKSSLIAINDFPVNCTVKDIESLPSILIKKLYELYKDLNKETHKIIDEEFQEYFDTDHCKQRWVSFKYGYKFKNEDLTPLQTAWLYMCHTRDINDDFKRKYDLSKYMVNHITTATINPKAYVQHLRRDNTESEFEEKEGTQVDANKDIFEQLKRKKGESEKDADKRVYQFMKDRLEQKDYHDEFILNATVEKFKTAIRRRKVYSQKRSKASVRITKKDVAILTNKAVEEANANNPYIFEKINYEDICKSKNFHEIPNKLEIIKEIYAEENSEEFIPVLERDKKPDLVANIKKERTDKPSLRDLLKSKGVDLKEAQNMKLGELDGGQS